MTREKRLGRGLEALLGKVAAAETRNETLFAPEEIAYRFDAPEGTRRGGPADRPPEKADILAIDPNPYQPRREFDAAELDALAASMQAHGLLQPIVVRQVGERYQLIAGERRLRAATRAGWSEVPVRIQEVDDRQMAELALTENLQRVDLNAIEKATAFARYLETYAVTHEELAGRLEINRSTVTNLLRLLELPAELQEMVMRGSLSPGHVRPLLSLDHEQQRFMAERILTEGWNVRQTEQAVKAMFAGGELVRSEPEADTKKPEPAGNEEHLRSLEQDFRNRLGSKVKLSHKNGRGKIVISFRSNEEFERLYTMICRERDR